MFSNLAGLEVFFLFCAAVGGFFVFIRLVMQFMGVDHDADPTAEAPVNMDAHHADSDIGFKFLSLHGLTAFFMMFGLVGLALSRNRAGAGLSVAGAVAAGVASVWLISKIFSSLVGLQSSGTLDLANAVGKEGVVYLHIPPGGTGKVQIEIQNRLTTLDAVAEDREALATGTRVRVTAVAGGEVLRVRKV